MFSVRRVHALVRSSGQFMLPRYLMNGLSNLDETYRKYSLSPTDDMIKLRMSEVSCQMSETVKVAKA